MQIKRIPLKSGGKQTVILVGESTYRANRVFIVIMAIIMFWATMWPGYPLFSGIEPMILGLPLSFAWVILWVIIGFLCMLALYFSDNKEEEP